MNGYIVIPARLESSRLPRKLLLSESGKPLLAHVIDSARNVQSQSDGRISKIIVAVDDEELAKVTQSEMCPFVMTAKSHPCGTSRIAEALEQCDPLPDFVINLQADEPEIEPQAVNGLIDELLKDSERQMATLITQIESKERFVDPNTVKAVIDCNGRALYFSRAPIPFDRDSSNEDDQDETVESFESVYHHIGIYAYRTEFLQRFVQMNSTPLEEKERLEQLRVLENGYSINTRVVPSQWVQKGIDTPEDYRSFVQRQLRQVRAA